MKISSSFDVSEAVQSSSSCLTIIRLAHRLRINTAFRPLITRIPITTERGNFKAL
jgi:hypothetical protein